MASTFAMLDEASSALVERLVKSSFERLLETWRAESGGEEALDTGVVVLWLANLATGFYQGTLGRVTDSLERERCWALLELNLRKQVELRRGAGRTQL